MTSMRGSIDIRAATRIGRKSYPQEPCPLGQRDSSLCCRHPGRLGSPARLKLILDTNIVLDWLVFRDTSVAELQPALDRGHIELLTHPPALDELRRVLAYAQFKLAMDRQQELFSQYRSHTRLVNLPDGLHLDNLGLPLGFPRCRDRDDQHFLALAYHQRVDALVSKDAAILELSKRLRKFSVTVLDPAQLARRLSHSERSFP